MNLFRKQTGLKLRYFVNGKVRSIPIWDFKTWMNLCEPGNRLGLYTGVIEMQELDASG